MVEALPIAESLLVNFDLRGWSPPDGSRLAIVGRGRDGVRALFSYALASRSLTKAADRVDDACWSPDGRRLIAAYRNRLFIVDSATGTTRDLLPPGALPPHASVSPAISRDGRHIAFVERTVDGDIWAMTLP